MKKQNILLNRSKMFDILDVAKTNLETSDEGFLPILLYRIKGENKFTITPLDIFLSATNHNEKILGLSLLGLEIKKTEGNIEEAIMLVDAYYLKKDKNYKINDNDFPIRDNPLRQEALCIYGKNIDNSLELSLIQPYTRITNKFIYEKPIYIKNKKDDISSSILDYLFDPIQAKLKEDILNTQENKNKKNIN